MFHCAGVDLLLHPSWWPNLKSTFCLRWCLIWRSHGAIWPLLFFTTWNIVVSLAVTAGSRRGLLVGRVEWTPHQELDSRNKIRVHTIKFNWNWFKFVGDDLVWHAVTLCKAVWLTYTWVLHQEPILEIKSRVHTIKFYRDWLKFFGDDSVLFATTLYKAVWLDLHMCLTSRVRP